METNNTKTKYKFVVYPGNFPDVPKEAILRIGNFVESDSPKSLDSLSFIWHPTGLPHIILQKIEKINIARKFLNPLIVNHIDALRGITSKNCLVRSLRRYYSSTPACLEQKYSINSSIPDSYLVEVGGDSEELEEFEQKYREFNQGIFRKSSIPMKHCTRNKWLLKPSNLNQGRGIEMSEDFSEIRALLSQKPPFSTWILQKYIEQPLLYFGRKFDIRLWVLVTDRADVFLYRSGYIRTSSDLYSLESHENYIHLTNNCLQQHGKRYGLHEEGNTLELTVLEKYLETQYAEYGVSDLLSKHLIPRMKDLILDTIYSIKNSIIVSRKKSGCNFELLGYDFMVDEDLRVWLIECNTNPYLGAPNSSIAKLLPQMMDDLFALVLQQSYPSQEMNTNGFELVHCERHSQFSPSALSQHRGYNSELLYPIKSLISTRIETRVLQQL